VLKDLPDKLYSTITIEPTDELRETYETVKHQILGEINTSQGNMAFNINNILTRLLRLQQITSGFITLNNRITELKSRPKLDALIDEVESIVDANESVVIWCRFLKSIDMISAALTSRGISNVTMSGVDKGKQTRYKKWKSFQTEEKLSAFMGQVESGGFGIELFKLDSNELKSQHMIFYENTWSLDTRMQAMDRIHRIGQKSLCRYVDLVVEDTIDQKLLDTLSQNQQIADLILEEGVKSFLK